MYKTSAFRHDGVNGASLAFPFPHKWLENFKTYINQMLSDIAQQTVQNCEPLEKEDKLVLNCGAEKGGRQVRIALLSWRKQIIVQEGWSQERVLESKALCRERTPATCVEAPLSLHMGRANPHEAPQSDRRIVI